MKTAFLRDERLERLTRKPVVASTEEQESNPAARKCFYLKEFIRSFFRSQLWTIYFDG